MACWPPRNGMGGRRGTMKCYGCLDPAWMIDDYWMIIGWLMDDWWMINGWLMDDSFMDDSFMDDWWMIDDSYEIMTNGLWWWDAMAIAVIAAMFCTWRNWKKGCRRLALFDRCSCHFCTIHLMIRRDASNKWILKPFESCLYPVRLSRCRNHQISDAPPCRSSFHIRCKAGMSNLPPELDQILKDVDSNGSGRITKPGLSRAQPGWMYPSDSCSDLLPMSVLWHLYGRKSWTKIVSS